MLQQDLEKSLLGEPKYLKTAKYSATTLLRHLKQHSECQKKFDDLKEARPNRHPLPRHIIRYNFPFFHKLHLIACTNLSFNVVNHPTFKALFTATSKNSETLKEETHYRMHVLPLVYKLVVKRVQSELDKCDYLSFTSDVWSGPTKSFISLTAHGITSEWARVKYILAIREFGGSHSGERIQQIVYELLRERNIERERVHVILHDQASSMISAFDGEDDIEDADCGAHKINLIVRNALFPKGKGGKVKVTPVATLLASCRAIVTHFRLSHQACEDESFQVENIMDDGNEGNIKTHISGKQLCGSTPRRCL